MKCIHCLNSPKFGQLIIRKIIRIIATKWQIFGGKNVQNSTSAGAPPQAPFGELTALIRWWSSAYSAPRDHLAAFKEPYF